MILRKTAILILMVFATSSLPAQKIKNLSSIDWLVGMWEMEGKKGNQYEEWKLVNENRLEGKGYKIFKKDTVSYEKLEIVMEGSDIYYIATVRGQNNEQPVRFKMTEGNRRKLLFENSEHDFPKKIHYQWKQNDRFNVEVAGLMKGKKKTILYLFKKI